MNEWTFLRHRHEWMNRLRHQHEWMNEPFRHPHEWMNLLRHHHEWMNRLRHQHEWMNRLGILMNEWTVWGILMNGWTVLRHPHEWMNLLRHPHERMNRLEASSWMNEPFEASPWTDLGSSSWTDEHSPGRRTPRQQLCTQCCLVIKYKISLLEFENCNWILVKIWVFKYCLNIDSV